LLKKMRKARTIRIIDIKDGNVFFTFYKLVEKDGEYIKTTRKYFSKKPIDFKISNN